MPSMITTCPSCGRKGIMKKSTGVCVRCSAGAVPAKVEPLPPPPTPRPSRPSAVPLLSKRFPIVRGRIGR